MPWSDVNDEHCPDVWTFDESFGFEMSSSFATPFRPRLYGTCGGLLGWEPRHTMQEAIAKTVDWYRGVVSDGGQ
jgi:nucleoside-diphosphate-sugar epimerase